MNKRLVFGLILLLAGCQTPALVTPALTSTAVPSTTSIIMPSATLTATIETVIITQTPTPTEPVFDPCCPLEDETFESLSLIITKPLDIPPFGQDIGHHGVDFAYFKREERDSIQGIEIYAILSGNTITTLEDNYPYGYTIIIETPLSTLPEALQQSLLMGYLPVPEDPEYRLFCPEISPPQHNEEFSIYHLYAHMEIRPPFNTGDPVSCGQKLGTVGNTGYSSNPHLHLETRLGPSGADFITMAHYQNTNTLEQMSTYCLWRMSGYYQLFDPFLLFNAGNHSNR